MYFYLFIVVLLSSTLSSQNLKYAKHSNHTLTIPSGSYSISYGNILMNDKIDILKIKESQFGSSSAYDAIGDTTGREIEVRYGISDKLMINLKQNKHNIDYSSASLNNTQYDVFLRYNLFHNSLSILNSGLSIDIGYEKNSLKDFYLNELSSINDLIRRAFPTEDAKIEQNFGNNYLNSTKTGIVLLNQSPYAALKDTHDKSYYLKILAGYYTKNSTFDIYGGIKQTSISNLITPNDEIVSLANSYGLDIQKRLDRDEKMYFIGLNYTVETKNNIFELNCEYDKFIRDTGLNYIDNNVVIDATVSYKLSKQWLFYIGGKLMYRQLNGVIPYLYNNYSQTSYDNTYGYTRYGLQFVF